MKATKYYVITMTAALLGGGLVYAQQSQTAQPTAGAEPSSGTEQKTTAQESSVGTDAAGAEKSGKKVTLKDLPEEVQKTIKGHAGALNVENIQEQEINGQKVYTASFDKENMITQLTVGADGSLQQFQRSQSVVIATVAPAVEKSEIKMSDLPQPVQEVIKQQAKAQPVGNISSMKQGDETMYHAEFNRGGVHTELLISEDGSIMAETQQTALITAPLENAQKLSLSSAPQPVQRAIREQAGVGKVTDIDKGQWKGEAAYKVMVEMNGRPMPMVISENGQILGETVSEAAGAGKKSEQESAPSQPKETDSPEQK